MTQQGGATKAPDETARRETGATGSGWDGNDGGANGRDAAATRPEPPTPESPRLQAWAEAGRRWAAEDAFFTARVPRRAARLAVAAVPVLVLAWMGYGRRWVAEDAFITFRVARHLLAGNGPVFNAGERVEAATHPLWLWMLSAWAGLGGGIEIGAVVMGLALTLLGLVAGQAGALRLLRWAGSAAAARRFALPLGALVVAVVPATWDYATSGLETGLAFGWLGGSFWLLAWVGEPAAAGARPRARAAAASVAAVLGLGPLIRPDLAVFSAAFLAALATVMGTAGGPGQRPNWARWARVGLAAAALPAGYQVFRMGYFAALVPNTALAKEAGEAYWSQGWRYLRDFGGTYWLIVPLAALTGWIVAAASRFGRGRDWAGLAVLVAAPAAALVHAIWVIRVGGDFMHGRFLLPALFGGLLPVMAVPMPPVDRGRVGRSARVAAPWGAAVVVIGWAAVCGWGLRVPYLKAIGPWGIADERGFYVARAARANPVTAEDYAALGWRQDGLELRDRAARAREDPERPRQLLLVGFSFTGDGEIRELPLDPAMGADIDLAAQVVNIGVAGYTMGPRVFVVDRFGLADPLAARVRLTKRGRPGHEKEAPEVWSLARYGDPALTEPPGIVAAREALACGELAELERAVSAPLNWGRFWENVAAAPGLHGLRVDGNPDVAREELCGGRGESP